MSRDKRYFEKKDRNYLYPAISSRKIANLLGYLKDSNAAAYSVDSDLSVLRSDSSTCAFQDLH